MQAQTIKDAAAGRWPEILAAVAGIDSARLDGKHYPCPKCGGVDRFRLIDASAGAVFCNQCFNAGNGDGIAAVKWALGLDFKAACRKLADYLRLDSSPARIVATYDYYDEGGELLFQVCRMQPKDFRQRRPDGKGGWLWTVKGVRVVPYRLPELLAADAAQLVFVCEGEKDCDALARLGLVATTNAGGAGGWKSEHCEALRGRKVVVVPDYDDAGQNHAWRVADSLQGIADEVRILELSGLPPKGDVSDWLDAGGTTDELLTLAGNAPEFQPDSELPTVVNEAADEPTLERVPFPVDLLPHPISTYITQASGAIGCDPSAVALPLFASLAAAIGNTRRIELKPGYCEPSILWTALVAYSGEQKSPAHSAGVKFLQRKEEEEFLRLQAAQSDHKKKYVRYKAELSQWKRNKEGDPPNLPEPPIGNRYIVGDITIEAIADRLQNAPRGLLLERDELSSWLKGFNQYKQGGRGSDANQWIELYGARPIRIDRKGGSQSIYVPRGSVSVTGTIQPKTLQSCLGREHFENGLAARFLLSFPEKRLRTWSDATIDDTVSESVNEIFQRLIALDFSPDILGRQFPIDLKLTDGAKAAFIDFYNPHWREWYEMQSDDNAALWSKLASAGPRLALIVHCVRNAANDPSLASALQVDEQSMSAGISLVRWFAAEGMRIYRLIDSLGGDSEPSAADSIQEHQPGDAADSGLPPALGELLSWIMKRGGRVSPRDVARGPRRLRGNADDAEKELHELVRLGYGQWDANRVDAAGRRQPGMWFVCASPELATAL